MEQLLLQMPDYAQSPTPEVDASLDRFIHQRSRILRTKLEILAAEIMERLRLRRRNQQRIGHQRETVETMLGYLAGLSHYHGKESREKGALYQATFDLDREARDQDVDCWRDVVGVMRDFLGAWEAHEQTEARAVLLRS